MRTFKVLLPFSALAVLAVLLFLLRKEDPSVRVGAPPDVGLPEGASSLHTNSKGKLEASTTEVQRSAESETVAGDVSSTPGEAQPAAPLLTEEETQWMTKWGALSVGKLDAAYQEFSLDLARLATPVYDEYESHGDYEVVGVGGSYTASNWNRNLMVAIRMKSTQDQDQRILKITVRESEYPELYALHREMLWMSDRVEVLRKLALR